MTINKNLFNVCKVTANNFTGKIFSENYSEKFHFTPFLGKKSPNRNYLAVRCIHLL